jgi:ABC-type nickel/cobalt efflux system permease component RcnA
MTAAFIVAIRGTAAQAVLLALAATVSHTAIVWVLALLALTYGKSINVEATDPYFQILSGAIILGMALWMMARLRRARRQHGPAHHDHRHDHSDDADDKHTRAHADELRARFAGGKATTGQIILLGLSGGLLPCAAAVTVLLLCLQLKRFWLGVTLVLCFSIGLALTLMLSGVLAAWGARQAVQRWKGFDAFAARAPYGASVILIGLGLYVAMRGLLAL